MRMDSTFTCDRQSFLVNGTRIFIHSGSVHYFRFPRSEWRGVLAKARLAGLNCIDTYLAWNFHEPREGRWEFEGDKDCAAFIKLCAELGLWVIARPGPYICAEWDFGGFPWWLRTKPGIKFREYNPIYLKYVDLYFDRVVPILARQQITNGGPVILVQVENEYGNLNPDPSAADSAYLAYLRDGLRRRGINVPLISCRGEVEGAIEAANFWSGADQHLINLARKQPDSPKLVTEFWSGWFENWGAGKANHKTPALLEKRIMEIIRAGFTGLNHYMFYGGTNFGSWGGRTVGDSNIFMTTSYDYDAPLNEYGGVTPKYYVAKRLGYFLRSAGPLSAESTGSPAYRKNVPQMSSARKSIYRTTLVVCGK